jgi:hypothetical protein
MAQTQSRVGLTAEGSLYEAFARGNKDAFFFEERLELEPLNPFENRAPPEGVPPVIHELRRIPPLNGAEFGRSCEFEFETAGDIFVRPTVLIDLPSWLPRTAAAAVSSGAMARAGAGAEAPVYGYTNGAAYFLFSKIQIYQDKLLLLETSGDALWAGRAARGSLNSAYLEAAVAGWHTGSAEDINAAGVPGRLRLELPFIGGPTYGFPSIAMRKQSFKLRLTLRPLEEIVESSDAAVTVAQKPWSIPSFTLWRGGSPAGAITPLAREEIGAPQLQLETRHIYTDGETQLALRSRPLEIPYSKPYENTFTFGAGEYAPLSRGAAVASVTNRLDANHPASRVYWMTRALNDLRAGRRWKVGADISGEEYYGAQSLLIAGRDRETLFSPMVWGDLTTHAKEDRDPGAGISEMSWDIGSITGAFAGDGRRVQPEGSINFTTADRPTFYTELLPVPADTILTRPSTEMTAVVESWVLYNIEGDRGFLKYGN